MPKSALLIIDMINDFNFTNGPKLSEKATEITIHIKQLKQMCRSKNIPIIYINDHYQTWKADIKKITEHCTNELSKKIISTIPVEEYDYFLIKPHYSAFYETPLQTLLQHLEVNHLIITGIAGNICVLFTANDAYMRKFQITIPSDCIASNCDEDNYYALTMMENILKANVLPTSQIKTLISHK